ncbi:hypothetical protein CWB55_04015 [Staphylococcus hominis]|nr:hypothetical protein CWC34_03465 [Staphylococcus hominis]PJM56752.1 hypothetical protein CWB55_04015 [Staphylococcus hominis]
MSIIQIINMVITSVLFYWFGRIDGFNKSRYTSKIDIKISNSIMRLSNFIIAKFICFFKIIFSFFRK